MRHSGRDECCSCDHISYYFCDVIAGGLPGRPGMRFSACQSKRPRGEAMALLTTEDVLNKKFQYVKCR